MRGEKSQAILSESPLLGLDYECAKLYQIIYIPQGILIEKWVNRIY